MISLAWTDWLAEGFIEPVNRMIDHRDAEIVFLESR